jgi:hypothetical protein
MDNEQERKTHFQGFAELVAQELKEQGLLWIDTHVRPLVDPPIDFDYEKIKQIIAQRAYDLVLHAVWNIAPVDLERLLMKDVAAKIPDLTEWPKPE